QNGGIVATPSPGAATAPGDNLTVERIRVDNRAGTETNLGYDCIAPSDAVAAAMGAAPFPQPEPVVITVTLQDVREMPVAPMIAHAGPPDEGHDHTTLYEYTLTSHKEHRPGSGDGTITMPDTPYTASVTLDRVGDRWVVSDIGAMQSRSS